MILLGFYTDLDTKRPHLVRAGLIYNLAAVTRVHYV